MSIDTNKVWDYDELLAYLGKLIPYRIASPHITGSVGHSDPAPHDLDLLIYATETVPVPAGYDEAEVVAGSMLATLKQVVSVLHQEGFFDLYLDKATRLEWGAFDYAAGVHDARAYRNTDIKINSNSLPIHYYQQTPNVILTGLDIIWCFNNNAYLNRVRVQHTISNILRSSFADWYYKQDKDIKKCLRRWLWEELLPLTGWGKQYWNHFIEQYIWKGLDDLWQQLSEGKNANP